VQYRRSMLVVKIELARWREWNWRNIR